MDEKKKIEIYNLIYEYYRTDNLFKLAEALMVMSTVFKDNKFPIGMYKKWIRKNQK